MKKTIVALAALGMIVASCSESKKPVTLNNTQLSIVLPEGVLYKDTCRDISDYIFEKGSTSKLIYTNKTYYKNLESVYNSYKNAQLISQEKFDNGMEVISFHPASYNSTEPDTNRVQSIYGMMSKDNKLITFNMSNIKSNDEVLAMMKSVTEKENGNLPKSGLNIELSENYEVNCREDEDELYISKNLIKLSKRKKYNDETITSVIDRVKSENGIKTIEDFSLENGIKGLATQYKDNKNYELHAYLFQGEEYITFDGKVDSLNQIETFKGILEGVQVNTKE